MDIDYEELLDLGKFYQVPTHYTIFPPFMVLTHSACMLMKLLRMTLHRLGCFIQCHIVMLAQTTATLYSLFVFNKLSRPASCILSQVTVSISRFSIQWMQMISVVQYDT